MSGPLLVTASQKRLRRLASWSLPLLGGALVGLATFQGMHP